jgi:hypothetical protein
VRTFAVPTPAPQPTPARSPAPVSLQWTRLDQSGLPSGGVSDGIVAGRNRFLVLIANGGLMASADGVNWSLIGTAPGRVYDDARGLFAFGSGQTVQGSKAELSWSANGSGWKSLTDQPAFASGPCVSTGNPISGIYPIGNSLVAVGSAAAWSSLDGQTWQCLGRIPDVRINGGHDVLVGSGGTDPQSANYLWLSRDGATWQPTTETTDFMNPAPVASGFVAVGQSFFDAPAYLLTSPDGEQWNPQPVTFGSEILNESAPLASDGSRAVVVEDAPDSTAESPGDVWVSSTDGSTWSRYPLPRRRSDYAISAAILGNQVVVIGEDQGQNTPDGLIWTATIP